MKIMYLTTLLKMTWDERKSKKTKIVILICVVLMAFAGVLAIRKAIKDREAEIEEYQYNLASHEADLKEMETTLKAFQDNLATVQAEYDAQKQYCEDSIYMKMDGSAFYQGEMQYTITTSANLGYINSALTNYINSSKLHNELAGQLENVETTYLKDIVRCSVNNNVLTISVYHYDEDMAGEMIKLIDNILQKETATIAKAQGEFTLTLMGQSVVKKGDIAILNSQTGALNSLRTFTNNLSEAKNAVSNKAQDIDFFKRNFSLEEVTPLSMPAMVKIEIMYLILGLILGACALVGWTFFKVLTGKTISNSDYFVSLNTTVIGDYRGNADAELVTGGVGHHINLYAIKSQAKEIYISDLTEDNFVGKFTEQYQSNIEEKGVAVSCSSVGDSEQIMQKNMVECGNVLFVVRFGETAYKKFGEFHRICKQFDLKVIGVIIAAN